MSEQTQKTAIDFSTIPDVRKLRETHGDDVADFYLMGMTIGFQLAQESIQQGVKIARESLDDGAWLCRQSASVGGFQALTRPQRLEPIGPPAKEGE